MSRRILLVLLVTGIAALSAAAAEAQRLVAAVTEDVRGSDPRRELFGLADNVHLHVVEGLVGLRDDLDVGLMLAKKLSVGEAGRTYTFTLREGVSFHNGATLTSAHVKWSWNYLMAPDSLWRCRPIFAGEKNALKVRRLETPDERTVVFRLAEPTGIFLHTLARPDCAQTPVLHPDSLADDGSWDKPIGTGPFRIGRRRVGEYIDVHRFDDYASRSDPATGMVGRKAAMVDEVRFLIVGDASSRMLGLQANDIDVAFVPAPLVEAARRSPRVDVTSSESTAWAPLLLNTEDPMLRDRRVRQAIAAAIDRNVVARAATYGQSTGSDTPIPSYSTYHTGPVSAAGARKATARELLATAGYRGETLTISTTRRFPHMFDAAVTIQSMLREVGIDAAIEVVEWGLLLSRYGSRDYQAMSFGYTGRFSPTGMWERIIGTARHKVWRDEEAIRLLRAAENTRRADELGEHLAGLRAKFNQDVPAVSLFLLKLNAAVNARIRGFEPSPFEALRLWNVSTTRQAAQ